MITLEVSVWGRPVAPFHAIMAASTALVATFEWQATGLGGAGQLNAVWGWAAAVLLTAGWLADQARLAYWGLLLAAGVWAGRATSVLLDLDAVHRPWYSAGIACCWAGVAVATLLVGGERERA